MVKSCTIHVGPRQSGKTKKLIDLSHRTNQKNNTQCFICWHHRQIKHILKITSLPPERVISAGQIRRGVLIADRFDVLLIDNYFHIAYPLRRMIYQTVHDTPYPIDIVACGTPTDFIDYLTYEYCRAIKEINYTVNSFNQNKYIEDLYFDLISDPGTIIKPMLDGQLLHYSKEWVESFKLISNDDPDTLKMWLKETLGVLFEKK